MTVPDDYECLKGMTIKDVPRQFIVKNGHPQPYQGLAIDCKEGTSFQVARDFIKSVPESARQMLIDEVNTFFTVNENERAVVTFSVRSMLDLYLQARKFPPGSEIIMTGMNIPDMVQIMKEHQIKVVPVDLDIATMMPCVEDVRKSLSPQTKACIFAYIYGCTYDIAPFVEILNAANVEIIEDCAQSFRSLEKFKGSDFATMTMFSFGLIKFNTAFYGADTVFRNLNETHRQPNEKLLC